MKNLSVRHLGPIAEADINFESLTLLVGPQASGKSILLQLIKFLVDKEYILRTLSQYGYVWESEKILDRYFGEGMSGIWTKQTKVKLDNEPFSPSFFYDEPYKVKENKEKLFYIPAQRVLSLQNGWPRFFSDFEDSVPFVLRDFSETLRKLMDHKIFNVDNNIFPPTTGLKQPLKDSINDSIFHDGKIFIDKTSGKKRFKLAAGKSTIPFMAWSAGQKEFMPMLLSFYWLCPSVGTSRRDELQYVVLEEPEMGLHPQAIKSVLLQVMDLMSRGYKVIISTHSPVLLEFAWAMRYLQKNNASYTDLAKLFDLKNDKPPSLIKMLKVVLTKTIHTYYFDRSGKSVKVKNITSLDAGSEDKSIAEWGGLSSFSTKATELILKLAADEKK
jgi:energy-coupling factor transporter ATP-binding protein EcfA2